MVDLFDYSSQQIIVRVNGGIHKSRDECLIDFSEDERPSISNIIKMTCKKFGCREKAAYAVIYNKSGIKLFNEDANFIKADDVLYIALDGKCDFLTFFTKFRTDKNI